MFLSRVRRQDVRIISHAAEDPLMTDLYEEHKFIWELFPRNTEIKRDFLYRRVDERLGPLFYVLSRRKPTNQPEGWVIDTKKFEPIIKAGDMFQFSLRVNPWLPGNLKGIYPKSENGMISTWMRWLNIKTPLIFLGLRILKFSQKVFMNG